MQVESSSQITRQSHYLHLFEREIPLVANKAEALADNVAAIPRVSRNLSPTHSRDLFTFPAVADCVARAT